MLHTGGPSLVE